MAIGLISYFPLFLLAIGLAFFIPGNLFIARFPLTKLQKVTLSLSFGMVMWGLQGFLFGYLHARWLTYIYLLITSVTWILTNRKTAKRINLTILFPAKKNLLLSLIVAFAVSVQLLSSFANGITTSKGIIFCCQLPDSLFHIALTDELVTNFPPYEPGVSGVVLKNYHFLSNLINADLIRIFHIPVLYLQYPYSSLFVSLLLALNIITFSQLAIKKAVYSYWLLFFVFFSGDIMYLLTFFTYHAFNFNTATLSDATTLWYSPPRVYGILFLFSGINFLLLWLKEKHSFFLDLVLACTFGCLIATKVYFGIFALVGLSVLLPVYAYEKKIRKILVILAIFLISISLYLPINSGAGGLVYNGFWRFQDFAVNPLFGLQRMELARLVYLAHGNMLRVMQYNLTFLVLYCIFVFGTLLTGVIQTRKSLSLFPVKLHLFLIGGIGVSFILGSFFLQQTGATNTSQFLISVMVMLSVYAALAVTYWLGKIRRKLITIPLIIVIILLTVPRVLYATATTVNRTLQQKYFLVDNTELQAIDYIKKNIPENAVIMQDDLNYCLQMTIITKRRTYICNDASPADHGEDLKKRIAMQNDILQYTNGNTIKVLPVTHQVQYLYLHTNHYLNRKNTFEKNGYKIRYQNSEITLLQVP